MTIADFRATGAEGTRAPYRPAAIAAAVAGALMMALGAGVAARLPWQALGEHVEARSWPVAEASIRSVSLSQRSYAPVTGDAPATGLVLAVAYEYDVDGTVREGRRASFADRAGPHDRRLKTLYSRLNFALVTGRTVPVSYDPGDPGNAVLDTGFDWRQVAPAAGVGLAAFLLGLRLALSARRPARVREDC